MFVATGRNVYTRTFISFYRSFLEKCYCKHPPKC